MFPEKPSLDELQHFGVKGMHWGVRKEALRGEVHTRTRAFGNRSKLEYETAATLAGLAVIGVAFSRSPRAQKIMTVPASAAYHYMSDQGHRKKVYKALKTAGVLYTKL